MPSKNKIAALFNGGSLLDTSDEEKQESYLQFNRLYDSCTVCDIHLLKQGKHRMCEINTPVRSTGVKSNK
jgi:hypothetical protein